LNLLHNITDVSFPFQQLEGNSHVFWFKQSKTVTIHVVFSATKRKQYYELNFGVVNAGHMKVLTRTKTHKALRTFNTLVQICTLFLSEQENGFIIFSASDRSRYDFYNRRIVKYLPIFEKEFKLYGIFNFNDQQVLKEPYKPNNYYDEIVIGLK
jgi:hypothetical protein